MSAALLGELVRRRIPHVVGVYLAAGWGLLEFSDWVTNHFDLTQPLSESVIVLWLLMLPAVVAFTWKWGAPAGSAAPRPGQQAGKSIAVLPFANLSETADNEYLSDGISEELINALSKVEGLHVVSRTSVFAYKGRSEDIRTIGHDLNVRSVLEGSVQVHGNKLRVTTQLIDVNSGYHLWSERFDREMEDVFEIEDEIASNVVRALRVILREDERRALTRVPTTDVKAYEYYLRGRQFFHQTRRKSLEFAREMFERAIEIDPDYALAYSGLANASALVHMYYPSAQADLERADEASRKALELAPDLAEAHAARGFALFLMKRLEEAEALFQSAIELDPKLFEAHYFSARAYFQQGRLAEAAQRFEAAFEAREDYQAAFFAAQSHEALGNKAEALAAYTRALAVAEKHMDLNPDDPRAATMRAVSLCRLGLLEEGVHWAERALAIDPEDAAVRYNVACLYSLEGMKDKAIACLEEAIRVGFGNRGWLEHDPDLNPLRGDPRFEALISSM